MFSSHAVAERTHSGSSGGSTPAGQPGGVELVDAGSSGVTFSMAASIAE